MRRSLPLLIFILLIANTLFAQIFRFGVPNLEAEDKALYRFGFSLGIDIVDVNLKTVSNYKDLISDELNNELKEIYSQIVPAFNVGIIANLRLGEYFDLRFIPSFSIAHDINLWYRFENPINDPNREKTTSSLILRKIECHYVNFPLFVKFKSSRMHNVRIYALAGGQIGVNMMSTKNNKIPNIDPNGVGAEILPVIKPYDVQVKGGFGFDFYTTFFKCSTEFKVAFGVINMLEDVKKINDKGNINNYKNSPVYSGIQSLKSKTFTISVMIE